MEMVQKQRFEFVVRLPRPVEPIASAISFFFRLES